MDNYDDYEEEMEESSSEVKLLPILGLVVAFFFGYFLMFCIDKFMSAE